MSRLVHWFRWVARLEGITVLALFGVAMPLKYAAGVPEPVAWVGWMHGTMVFVYLIALGAMWRVEGWSPGRLALWFVASLVPGGTFLAEWRDLDVA